MHWHAISQQPKTTVTYNNFETKSFRSRCFLTANANLQTTNLQTYFRTPSITTPVKDVLFLFFFIGKPVFVNVFYCANGLRF